MNLEVGDGQVLYYEAHGDPNGVPAVVLHGGPGSGSNPLHRDFFDLDRYRVFQFDQRGCGRSMPHASDVSVSLETNTIGHLLRDIEALREHLGVERWVVFGHSFGSLLGLGYAASVPERVIGLVLAGVAVGRQSELDWIYGGIAADYPEAWARFTEGIDGDVIAAYRARVNDPDPFVRAEFARRWTEWDWATSSVAATPPTGRHADPAFQMARARLCTHYFSGDVQAAGELLTRPDHLARLNECDGVLINGEHDMQEGMDALRELWPRAECVVVPAAAHSVAEGGMPAAIRTALARFGSP